jgi:hypothetical protein
MKPCNLSMSKLTGGHHEFRSGPVIPLALGRSVDRVRLCPSIKCGIFPDSMSVEAHGLVRRCPFYIWSFLGTWLHLQHLVYFCFRGRPPRFSTAMEWDRSEGRWDLMARRELVPVRRYGGCFVQVSQDIKSKPV